MKKKILISFLELFMVCSVTVSAQAALIDNGDGTVTDDDLGIMWLQAPGPDANFANAGAWADSLVFAGHDDWRLPSALNFTTGLPDELLNSVNNEFGHLYGVELGNPANSGETAPLENYNPLFFWTGTPDPDGPGDAFAFFWSFDGIWGNFSSLGGGAVPILANEVLHVTAVRSIGDAVVPEPGTLLLLGSALAGLAVVRRKLVA